MYLVVGILYLVNQDPEGGEMLDVNVHGVVYQVLRASKRTCKIII